MSISPRSRPTARPTPPGATGSTIRIFNTQDGELVRSIKQEGWVQSLKFSGDGTRLFSVGFRTRVYTWDVASGTELGRCDAPEFGSLEGVAFAPDGVLGICAHSDGNLRLWDLTVGKRLHRLPRTLGRRLLLHPGQPGRGDPELFQAAGPPTPSSASPPGMTCPGGQSG